MFAATAAAEDRKQRRCFREERHCFRTRKPAFLCDLTCRHRLQLPGHQHRVLQSRVAAIKRRSTLSTLPTCCLFGRTHDLLSGWRLIKPMMPAAVIQPAAVYSCLQLPTDVYSCLQLRVGMHLAQLHVLAHHRLCTPAHTGWRSKDGGQRSRAANSRCAERGKERDTEAGRQGGMADRGVRHLCGTRAPRSPPASRRPPSGCRGATPSSAPAPESRCPSWPRCPSGSPSHSATRAVCSEKVK